MWHLQTRTEPISIKVVFSNTCECNCIVSIANDSTFMSVFCFLPLYLLEFIKVRNIVFTVSAKLPHSDLWSWGEYSEIVVAFPAASAGGASTESDAHFGTIQATSCDYDNLYIVFHYADRWLHMQMFFGCEISEISQHHKSLATSDWSSAIWLHTLDTDYLKNSISDISCGSTGILDELTVQ